MQPWHKLLDCAEPDEHLLQFYHADERPLLDNVSRYAWEGLKSGEGLILIAAPNRNLAIAQKLKELGIDVEGAVRDGQMVLIDVHQALAGFMRDGQPDWERFQSTVGATVRGAKARAQNGVIRAYGEMVGVLWEAGDLAAAIRLEHYWNELRVAAPFKLFCAYPIDVLSKGFGAVAVDALLCTHTHLLPGATSEHLEQAVNRAMDEVLGAQGDVVRTLIQSGRRPSWAKMPLAEGMILWLRNNLPEHADQIVELARQYRGMAALPASLS